jgi:hypothetical protein
MEGILVTFLGLTIGGILLAGIGYGWQCLTKSLSPRNSTNLDENENELIRRIAEKAIVGISSGNSDGLDDAAISQILNEIVSEISVDESGQHLLIELRHGVFDNDTEKWQELANQCAKDYCEATSKKRAWCELLGQGDVALVTGSYSLPR